MRLGYFFQMETTAAFQQRKNEENLRSLRMHGLTIRVTCNHKVQLLNRNPLSIKERHIILELILIGKQIIPKA